MKKNYQKPAIRVRHLDLGNMLCGSGENELTRSRTASIIEEESINADSKRSNVWESSDGGSVWDE
jgi:hypothetical protein